MSRNLEKQRTKAKIQRRLVAIALSVLLHAIVIGDLLLLYIRAHVPPKPAIPDLVLINAGNMPLSAGEVEPIGAEQETPEVATPEPQPAVKPQTPAPTKPIKAPEQLVTQNKPSGLSAADLEAKKKKQEEERLQREEMRKRKEREEQEKRERIRKQVGSNVAGAFNGSNNATGNQGTGSVPNGNQGAPGGSGDSYSLDGRTIVTNGGYPTRPTGVKAIRGKIRVRIIVNNRGQVTDAWVEPQGTQISDAQMRSAAVNAAKATRFNAIPGGNDQRGIITYVFDVQ